MQPVFIYIPIVHAQTLLAASFKGDDLEFKLWRTESILNSFYQNRRINSTNFTCCNPHSKNVNFSYKENLFGKQ